MIDQGRGLSMAKGGFFKTTESGKLLAVKSMSADV
jgi:hypothetical protein